MSSVYQRQYPTLVDWQDYPSISTPVMKDNLNHMDEGIAAVDEAVKNAVDELVEMIETGGGGGLDTIKHLIFCDVILL